MNFERNIKGFNVTWESTVEKNTNLNCDFFEMRDWQVHAFEQLQAAPFMILNAPMGSGKSWLMCVLSAFKIKQDGLRSIIVVPQTIIGSGFIKANVLLPDGEKLQWEIKNNLCVDDFSKGTVNFFIQWLESVPTNFSESSILCTHATLVQAYKKLKAEDRLHLFKNILLWIDEAHHIKNVAIENLDGAVSNNGIGELVAYLLDNHNENIQLGLTTASFFRGDKASLLTDRMEEKFKRFNLPYDEYLRSMKHLESFSFDFVLTGHNYVKGIEQIIKSRKGKDIIYIPHRTASHSTGQKYQEVRNIIEAYGEISHQTEDGITIVQGQSGELKILDLVSEEYRQQKKNYLNNPVLKKDPAALDVIIALGMFKEGADWPYADRCIIVGTRSSLLDVFQMIGRPFRDAENKKHVELIQLLPFSLDQQDDDSFRENLNNYLKAIYASLILENILNPVKIKSIQNVTKEAAIDGEQDQEHKIDWLGVTLPDDTKQQLLLEEVGARIVDIAGQNSDTISNTMLYDEYNKIVPSILENYGIIEHKEEVSKQIWGTLVRRGMQMQGISVENIDFNIIQDMHPLGFLLRYTSGICNINTFEKLREAIALSKIIWRPFEEARYFVRNLKLKNITEWRLYVEGKITHLQPLPDDIPKAPWTCYENKGWISLGDFLGTGVTATRLREYRPFIEAREYIHSLKLKTSAEWKQLLKNNIIPKDIPAHPDRTYESKGWVSWKDFLGIDIRDFRSFEEARNFTRTLNLKNQADWYRYAKTDIRPKNIPVYPSEVYSNKGWISWGDWLGTGRIASQNCIYRSFEETREFVRALGLKNNKEWRAWSKSEEKPQDIPAAPDRIYYNKGWISWGDFLGTQNIGSTIRKFREFNEVKTFARQYGFKSRKEWEKWLNGAERPNDIPSNPSKAYANEWKGWGDFLDTGTTANFDKQFRPFIDARIFAQSLLLKGKDDWFIWTKSGMRPSDIPTAPSRTYAKKGWLGWNDWLGTSSRKNKKFTSENNP